MIYNHGIQSIAIQMGYLATPRHQIRFCHSTNYSNLLNGPSNKLHLTHPTKEFVEAQQELLEAGTPSVEEKSIQEVAFYTFIDANARNVFKSSRKKETVDSKSEWSPEPRSESCDAAGHWCHCNDAAGHWLHCNRGAGHVCPGEGGIHVETSNDTMLRPSGFHLNAQSARLKDIFS